MSKPFGWYWVYAFTTLGFSLRTEHTSSPKNPINVLSAKRRQRHGFTPGIVLGKIRCSPANAHIIEHGHAAARFVPGQQLGL